MNLVLVDVTVSRDGFTARHSGQYQIHVSAYGELTQCFVLAHWHPWWKTAPHTAHHLLHLPLLA